MNKPKYKLIFFSTNECLFYISKVFDLPFHFIRISLLSRPPAAPHVPPLPPPLLLPPGELVTQKISKI